MDSIQTHKLMNYMRGTYKVLENEWQKNAREIGLTQAEQHVMWIVYLEKEITITRISEIGLWDVSTVMQVLKRLKNKAFVKLEKKANDRRVSYVSLTDVGLEKVDASTQYSYSVMNYLDEYREKSEEHAEFLKEMYQFQMDFNKHFHGSEFVNWVEKQKLPIR
ncbi:BlaI/MecI/CopY family transcriptional regulator [Bacillus sp. NTK071]|uniref:BlaI/MecI/CopY family transcriptional regulator n=1 Tax=Bacillus sp. NTK071 TaxID=2802175 RepID=UPI001A8CB5F8|nr:BlaI/MecI/CopY family transcriptional regulator [Bacillus sp. NTK071]MBN8208183.1 BlaI/MecI/CopY family transcriptional regulator [Bacillus sp. NTK071]